MNETEELRTKLKQAASDYINHHAILITGVNGFIGHNLAKRLIRLGHRVYGVDFSLKKKDVFMMRHNELMNTQGTYTFIPVSEFSPRHALDFQLDIMVHLAARTGVREAQTEKADYIKKNVTDLVDYMDFAVKANIPVIYASSSSVYGSSDGTSATKESAPFQPLNLYGATKMFAEGYIGGLVRSGHLINAVGLRFFTVFGPWGRPDMAVWKWTEELLRGEKSLVNAGSRSYTPVIQVVSCIHMLIEHLCNLNINDTGIHSVFNISSFGTADNMKVYETLAQFLGLANAVNISLGSVSSIEASTTAGDMQEFGRIHGTDFLQLPLRTALMQWCDWYLEHRSLISEYVRPSR